MTHTDTDYSNRANGELNVLVARRQGWRVEESPHNSALGRYCLIAPMQLLTEATRGRMTEALAWEGVPNKPADDANAALALDFGNEMLTVLKTPPIGSVKPFFIAFVSKSDDTTEYHRTSADSASRAITIAYLRYRDASEREAGQ